EKAATSDDVMAMYEIGNGSMISAPALPDAASKCMKLTAAGYVLRLDGQDLNVVTPSSGPVATYGSQALTLDTASPVLCESYYTDSVGFEVNASNSNGEQLGGTFGFKGFNGLSYNPSSGVIAPNAMQASFGPWAKCVSRNSADAKADHITFSGSFESGADVHVAYLDANGDPLLDASGNPTTASQIFATIDQQTG